jgi:nitroreductase
LILLEYWGIKVYFQSYGIKPIYREARRSDMRIVAHKSAALAAENFMISMAAINYDSVWKALTL